MKLILAADRPEFDVLVAKIGAAMNAAHKVGTTRGQAAMNALTFYYPELAQAIQACTDVVDADVFSVPDSNPRDARWDDFWYAIRKAYQIAD